MNKNVPTEVTTYLDSLNPGYLPEDLFYSITRITVSPILEIVPLRKKDGQTQVLLLNRPSNDPYWPNMLHTPGTYIRATDTPESLESAFERLRIDELNSCEFIFSPKFVRHQFHKVNRGMELSLVYFVDLSNQDCIDEESWFNVSDLPGSIVKTQLESILDAVKLFNK